MDFRGIAKKYLLLTGIVVALAGCKTSPTADEASDDISATINTTPTATTESSSIATEGTFYLGKFHLFPRQTNGWDETGWSVLTPSDDSRLIYVSSSSGNDETAEFVDPNSVEDVEYPASIKPFKTIEAALAHARDGYPDWVLLKRGDEWRVSEIIRARAGRSIYERSVITSYGPSQERPLVNTTASNGFRIWIDTDFVAIVGISLYAKHRDPDSDEFAGWGAVGNPSGIYAYQPEGTTKRYILLENNEINFFGTGIVMTGKGSLEDVVVRRNIIRNSYSETSHSQGIYAARASVLLEENIFDHNGWYKQQIGDANEKEEGQATMFNHNTYFSESNHTISQNNIFLRSSSIHQKWAASSPTDVDTDQIMAHDILISDNVFVGGEIGVSAGGNVDHNTGPRWRDMTVRDNILLAIGRDQPTNRTLGWNIDATDWDGGLICGNYILHNDNPLVTNLFGIRLNGHSNNVVITKNTIHGLISPNPNSRVGGISIDGDPKNNIIISENNIQLTDSNMRVLVPIR